MNAAFGRILNKLDEPQFDLGCTECPCKEKCDTVERHMAMTGNFKPLCAETMRTIAKEIVLDVAKAH